MNKKNLEQKVKYYEDLWDEAEKRAGDWMHDCFALQDKYKKLQKESKGAIDEANEWKYKFFTLLAAMERLK